MHNDRAVALGRLRILFVTDQLGTVRAFVSQHRVPRNSYVVV